LVQSAVLILIFLLLFRIFGAEPYQVPTGSMWPALAGNHRACDCPRCGYRVLVGRHRADKGRGRDGDHYYRAAFCPNCGCTNLDLDHVPECPGDHLLVNKNVFDLRRPRRWEMVVFRCPADPGRAFVKRVVGLPGERLQIRGGDVFVNGALVRKTLAEFKAVRIPILDNNFQPRPDGFRRRWEGLPPRPDGSPLVGTVLHLDGEAPPERYQGVAYRNYLLDEHQSQPLQDEYAYNCGDPRAGCLVHDFMLECDCRVARGSGEVLFGITDGHDRLVVELPVTGGGAPAAGRAAQLREGLTSFASTPRRRAGLATVYRRAPGFHLTAGKTYHVELAFVDRRLSLAVDGSMPFEPLDLPAVERRAGVIRPVRLGARGVKAEVSNVRLYRDIHYTAAGDNGVRQVVSLGAAEYFVLGDNSPNSDDSRFWPNRGVVRERALIGKPFLAHLPSRVVSWKGTGGGPGRIAPDWSRIRWLH
jgi:signal peptidase I